MPLVLARPREEMEQVAIEEWMAASPLYSLRTQRALNFGNGDVPTIFKNIQLDIGAPHQFMDFRYKVDDAEHGEFWLDHCGALMDVEPMGEEFVHGMCHDIEDPTFDATAGATNPHAQVRPIHRPPRVPADREPHCHWTVEIDRRRANRSSRTRTCAIVGSRRSPASRSTMPDARRRARRLGRLLRRVRSRLRRSRTSRTARSWSRCRRSRCRATCCSVVPARASRSATATTKRPRINPQVFTGLAGPHRAAAARPRWTSTATTPTRSPSSCSSTRVPPAHLRRPRGRGRRRRPGAVRDPRLAPSSTRPTTTTGSRSSAAPATARSTRSCRR